MGRNPGQYWMILMKDTSSAKTIPSVAFICGVFSMPFDFPKPHSNYRKMLNVWWESSAKIFLSFRPMPHCLTLPLLKCHGSKSMKFYIRTWFFIIEETGFWLTSSTLWLSVLYGTTRATGFSSLSSLFYSSSIFDCLHFWSMSNAILLYWIWEYLLNLTHHSEDQC